MLNPNIDLSKVKKEHLALICIILIVIIAFTAYKNVFRPLSNRIKEVYVQIEQRKKNIQKAKISPQELKKLEDEIDKLKTKAGYYEQKLKTPADVPQILKELNQVAERLKIKIISVNPLQIKETPLPGEEESLLQVPIKIKLQCGYHQLGVFINQIENSPRFMKIAQLKINVDSRNVWMHQAELLIAGYRLVSNK